MPILETVFGSPMLVGILIGFILGVLFEIWQAAWPGE